MINGHEPAMPNVAFDQQGNFTHVHDEGHFGLTIRQHFAAMAMQGILSNPELMKDMLKTIKGGLKDVLRVVALDSIDAANELISQLNEPQPA